MQDPWVPLGRPLSRAPYWTACKAISGSFPPIRSSSSQPGMLQPRPETVWAVASGGYEGMLLCQGCAMWGQLHTTQDYFILHESATKNEP